MKKDKTLTLDLPYYTREFFPSGYEIISKKEVDTKNNLWGKIKENTFVETGTFYGHGVTAALKNGCSDIHSIEINPHFFNQSCIRLMVLALYNRNICEYEIYNEKNFFSIVFGGSTRVSLYHGDTVNVLPTVLARITDPVFFWLDAHWSGEPTFIEGVLEEDSSPEVKCPILQELSIIEKHPIKKHTIAIDDYNQVCEAAGSFENIKKGISKINDRYLIRTKDKSSSDDKIIVASIN